MDDDNSAQTEANPEKVPEPSAPAVATPKKYEKPLSGLFAIHKPTGVTCMSLLEEMKELFLTSKLFVEHPVPHNAQPPKPFQKKNQFRQRKKQLKLVKLGQGGTLDPLASGVLIIGLNSATKKLSEFLNCTKVYRATGILGCKTDSYDRDGKIVGRADWKHVKAEDIQKTCQAIKGEHWQIPPIYSALKMDGKPLYEYARKNIPLPRPIEMRKCDVFDIRMVEWEEPGSHSYPGPTERISEEDGAVFEKMEALVHQATVVRVVHPKHEENQSPENGNQPARSAPKRSSSLENNEGPECKKQSLDDGSTSNDASLPTTAPPIAEEEIQVEEVAPANNDIGPAFTLEMTVSSGTYVRTIVHDIGQAVSSAATVVSLIRTRQGKFGLDMNSSSNPTATDGSDKSYGCIEWSVFEKAIQARKDGTELPRNEDALCDWEQELLKHIHT